MSSSANRPGLSGSSLNLYRPLSAERNRARWTINGFAASILVWTKEEWDQMADRPADAQYFPCGVWCALRLDD